MPPESRFCEKPCRCETRPQLFCKLGPMPHWWVNQNQTYRHELRGGFLWSPKVKADGSRNPFYESMQQVATGDIVFSFCDTRIKALGVASGTAQSAPKPNFGAVGMNWAEDGWLVPVEYRELATQIRPKDRINVLRPLLPKKYSPLRVSGDGNQSLYLTQVPQALATALVAEIGPAYQAALTELQRLVLQPQDASHENTLRGRTDVGPTFIEQLISARRGQGVFRTNVRLNETCCRVTGTTELVHLRASHIKPWRVSSDQEKLDGCNGLLLAPHVDHLFDRGYISFNDNGTLLVSPRMPIELLREWAINQRVPLRPFNQAQRRYLEYHRTSIFMG
jgi:putative restriction endonuclease